MHNSYNYDAENNIIATFSFVLRFSTAEVLRLGKRAEIDFDSQERSKDKDCVAFS